MSYPLKWTIGRDFTVKLTVGSLEVPGFGVYDLQALVYSYTD